MTAFGIRSGIKRLLRIHARTGRGIDREMDDELRSYLQERIDYLIARGVPLERAREEAMTRMGPTFHETRARLHRSAETREKRMRLREWFEDALQDVRYAARGLVHRPAFTAVAVLTLAIGIGATTAIFSAVNALLLKPLPFKNPEQLMSVSLVTAGGRLRPARDDMVWSYPKFVVFRDAQQVFSDLSLYSAFQFNISGGDEAERVRGEWTDSRYFPTLGVTIAQGRNFGADEDLHPGAPRIVIISDALWQRRFNADRGIVGKSITIDRAPYDIVGVAPAGFGGLSGGSELWIPITTRGMDELGPDQGQSHEFSMVARRKTGVTPDAANRAANALGARVAEAYPMTDVSPGQWGARARDLNGTRVAPLLRRSLLVLFGAVSLVLLIACVNLANLLLGRASARRREIAIRLSLGARRGRLVRLLLSESVLLSVIGGASSLAIAWWGATALSHLNPAATVRVRVGGLGAVGFSSISLDASALLFTSAVAVAIGVLFGLVPALQASNASLTDAIKDGSGAARGAAGGRALSGRRVLVVAEVALALMLLAGSGLMLRSLAKLLAVNPGFDARNVLSLRFNVPPGGVPRDSMPGFYEQLLGRLGAIPGAFAVGLTNCIPLTGPCNGTRITFLDRPKDDAQPASIRVTWATGGYFPALRIPLKAGRVFTDADRMGAPKVVVVNEAAAKQYWPNDNPLAKHVGIAQGGFGDGAEVVGVVGDVHEWPDSLAKPNVYLPYLQSPQSRIVAFVRTPGDPLALVGAARQAIRDVAPDYPVYDVQSMSERVAVATAQARLSAILLGLFAAVAFALAIIGIYGVLSFAVLQRTREIGIRMALGAESSSVLRLVIGEGMALAAVGVAIGLVAALWLTRVLGALLFDVAPSDPLTYVAIVALVGTAAVLASWLPARRAARVDPNIALRSE
jgi:predicted permease